MELHVIKNIHIDELFCQYPNSIFPQPCHIYLNLDTGECGTEYDPSAGCNATSEDVRFHRVLWWDIPLMIGETANELIATITPLLQRVLDGTRTRWCGQMEVRALSADAAEASAEIEWEIERWEGDLYVEPADEWLSQADLEVTDKTTDMELAELTERLENDALYNADNAIILHGTLEYLMALRDSSKEAQRMKDAAKAREEKVTKNG